MGMDEAVNTSRIIKPKLHLFGPVGLLKDAEQGIILFSKDNMSPYASKVARRTAERQS